MRLTYTRTQVRNHVRIENKYNTRRMPMEHEGTWGRGDFTIVPPRDRLYSGIAPVLTTVELSINGQNMRLRQRIKYVDPYFRDLMWSANP